MANISQNNNSVNSLNNSKTQVVYSTTGNAVKLLPRLENYGPYVKLYTEINSNLKIGDRVYLLYDTSTISGSTSIVLDNYFNYSGYTDIFYYVMASHGYQVLYLDLTNNSLVINKKYQKEYKDKTLDGHFLSKTYINDIYVTGGEIDGATIRNCILNEENIPIIDINILQSITLSGVTRSLNYDNKYDKNYIGFKSNQVVNQFTDDITISTYKTKNNESYGYSYTYNTNISGSTIENGLFYNCFIHDCRIDYGYYENCTIHISTIINGYFKNCIIENTCTWSGGTWYEDLYTGSTYSDFGPSVWISGNWMLGNFGQTGVTFPSKTWLSGTFNNGNFSNSIWLNGIFNGGTFVNRSIWYNGFFNGGIFTSSDWIGGIFNNGSFSSSNWTGGTFNNGYMELSIWSGGTFINGYIYDTNWIYGNFYNGIIEFPSGTTNNWNDGNFYDGVFEGGCKIQVLTGSGGSGDWLNGNFYNGKMSNSFIKNIIISNGIFDNIYFNQGSDYQGTTTIYLANTNNCVFESESSTIINIKNSVSNKDIFINWGSFGYDGFIIEKIILNDVQIGYPGYPSGSYVRILNGELNSGFVDSNCEWLNGNCYYGTFKGNWYDGTFYNGTFTGNWYDGIWKGGTFAGTWLSSKPQPFIQTTRYYEPIVQLNPGTSSPTMNNSTT